MGLVSFKTVCFVLIFVTIACCHISAFRLIHSSQSTHETKKPVSEVKERVKNLMLKDELSSSLRDKYRNETIKIQLKTDKDVPDKRHPSTTPERKIKTVEPTLPFNITKDDLILRIKEPKPVTRIIKSNKTATAEKMPKSTRIAKEADTQKPKIDIPKESVKEASTQKPKIDKLKESIKGIQKEKAKPKEPTTDAQKEKPKSKTPSVEVQEKAKLKEPPKNVEKEKPADVKVKVEKKAPPKEDVKPKAKSEKPAAAKQPPKDVKPSKQKPDAARSTSTTTTTSSKTPKKAPEPDSSSSTLYYHLPTFSPNFNLIENEECKKQGRVLIDNLNKHKLWALKMLDSTAKIPSGILRGNLNQFGDYDQCVSIFVKIPNGNKNDPDVKISGKYCLALIDFEAEIQEMKLPVYLAQSRAMIRSKIKDPGHFIPRFTTIRWGLCVPSGCSAHDAETLLEDSIKFYNDSNIVGVNFDVVVNADQCHVRKSPKKLLDYHYTTIATLGLTSAVCVIVFAATLRDIRLSESKDNDDETVEKTEESSMIEKIFMSFSLKRTVSTLLRRESDPDEIGCIHGVRTICTFVLYVAHKLIPVGQLPFTNKTTLTEISNNPLSILLRLSVIYTDSFLLISGVLTSYRMSKDIEEKGHIPWFNRIVARFVRLTPSLLLVLLYYAYVMELFGDGPLWNTVITPNVKLCKENWWKNILYIQNVYPFEEMCATHTHQLALDMQLSLIAPILVWLLYRRPLMGVFATILLHSVSVILRYYTTLNYRLSLVIYHGISISQLYRTANMLYASSLHRATPYIAGIGLGVLLRQMRPNFSMPKILSITGWIVAGYFATWALYTPSHLSSRTYQYDINEAAQYAALCSLAWALALSWLIFACFSDEEGYTNSLLSCRPMILFSRISYTFYLTQFIIFFYNVSVVRSALEFKLNTIVEISELLAVTLASTLLTLMIDTPAQKIKSVLLKSIPVADSDEISSAYENSTRKLSSDSQKSSEEN